jgi:hypothetical protein
MKIFQLGRLYVLLCSVFILGAASNFVQGDDRFALAVGQHGDLLVFGPHGEKAGDFSPPAIAQPVAINGGPSFQVSYGRDVNNMLTAILSPDASHPSDLHFSVLNKTVDTDKQAVVTLTFSSSLNRVKVDPGYIGLVQVNSRKVGVAKSATHHAAPAGTSSAAASSFPSHAAPAPRMNADDIAPRGLPPTSNDPAPEGASSNSMAIAQPVADAVPAGSGRVNKRRLFWPEPVTAGAHAPHVGPNEMKLVAVHGSVVVKTPDGGSEKGTNGMLVPSGATVETSSNSSAAVFMGGVDSARLAPNSGVIVAQNMEGTVRHTTVDLKKGAVFSRVGKRPGETQNYEVRTPDGVAAARGTEYLVVMFTFTTPDGVVHNVEAVFVNEGTVPVYVNNRLVGTITGGSGTIGMGSMGSPPLTQTQLQQIEEETLTEMQGFNVTTIQALFDYESGATLTQAEKDLLAEELYGAVPTDPDFAFTASDNQFLATVAAALHDLIPSQADNLNADAVPADESDTSAPPGR